MDPKEISQMRLKQVGLMNVSIFAVIVIFYSVISFYSIKFTHFFFILGIIVLIQAVYGLIKGNSTKSIIPLLEKVATYEKQRMGNEWHKLRKTGYIWSLIMSCFLFLQSYVNSRYSSADIFQVDLLLIAIIVFFMLIMVNVMMIVHFRRVDRSNSIQDMKGYTWKSNLIAVGLGIVFALSIMGFIIYYVISGIE